MPAAHVIFTIESFGPLIPTACKHAARRSSCAQSGSSFWEQDRLTIDIVDSFRKTGGVLGGDAMATRLRPHTDQPISLLARWIVNRQVVSFESKSQTLLPLAQFDLKTMTVKPCWRHVINLLAPAFDDFELATWLVRENSWLAGLTPIKAIENDFPAVIQAARADRFVALG